MKLLIFSACVLLFSLPVISDQKLDGIAAVVGDEVILISELDAYAAIRLNNLGISKDSSEITTLRKKFLDEIIDGKVLLVHGKKDSMISVTEEDVDEATNNHISMLLKQNNITIDSLEVELVRQQGITLAKFKSDARKIIREQLIKQKVQQLYLHDTKITRKDVENFYNKYKDSLPELGESVQLSQLTIDVLPSDNTRQSAYEKIIQIKKRLDNGENFTECAKKYSESPDASEGGDLGFIAKGTLSEIKFEEQAFNLKVGQISDPFETRLGFHILKLVEKRDQQVHIQQIFIEITPPESEIQLSIGKADSISKNCKDSSCFQKAIAQFSTSSMQRKNKGYLGWISVMDLSSEVKNAIDSLSKGQLSNPVVSGNSVSIYRIIDRVSSRKLSIENDYPILESKAKDIASQKKLITLVKNWKKHIFIEIRI